MSECCKSCGSVDLKVTIMDHGPHYSRIDCSDCGKFVKWGKKPVSEVSKENYNTGGRNMTINEVIIAGRLTRSPELKYTKSNTAVCKFSVALDRYMGEGKEKATDFINVTAWSDIAEFVNKHFDKGSKIIVKGNLKQNVWEDNDQKKHYDIEVWAEKVDFADSKKDGPGDSSTSNPRAGTYDPASRAEPPPQQGQQSETQPWNQPQQQQTTPQAGNNLPPWMTGVGGQQ